MRNFSDRQERTQRSPTGRSDPVSSTPGTGRAGPGPPCHSRRLPLPSSQDEDAGRHPKVLTSAPPAPAAPPGVDSPVRLFSPSVNSAWNSEDCSFMVNRPRRGRRRRLQVQLSALRGQGRRNLSIWGVQPSASLPGTGGAPSAPGRRTCSRAHQPLAAAGRARPGRPRAFAPAASRPLRAPSLPSPGPPGRERRAGGDGVTGGTPPGPPGAGSGSAPNSTRVRELGDGR